MKKQQQRFTNVVCAFVRMFRIFNFSGRINLKMGEDKVRRYRTYRRHFFSFFFLIRTAHFTNATIFSFSLSRFCSFASFTFAFFVFVCNNVVVVAVFSLFYMCVYWFENHYFTSIYHGRQHRAFACVFHSIESPPKTSNNARRVTIESKKTEEEEEEAEKSTNKQTQRNEYKIVQRKTSNWMKHVEENEWMNEWYARMEKKRRKVANDRDQDMENTRNIPWKWLRRRRQQQQHTDNNCTVSAQRNKNEKRKKIGK